MPAYKRVLLKLSGEVFGGGEVGIDPDIVQKVAKEIAAVARTGVQVAIVTGGLAYAFIPVAALSLGMVVAMTALEFLVAFLQAFVFTVLTCIYLNDVVNLGDGH